MAEVDVTVLTEQNHADGKNGVFCLEADLKHVGVYLELKYSIPMSSMDNASETLRTLLRVGHLYVCTTIAVDRVILHQSGLRVRFRETKREYWNLDSVGVATQTDKILIQRVYGPKKPDVCGLQQSTVISFSVRALDGMRTKADDGFALGSFKFDNLDPLTGTPINGYVENEQGIKATTFGSAIPGIAWDPLHGLDEDNILDHSKTTGELQALFPGQAPEVFHEANDHCGSWILYPFVPFVIPTIFLPPGFDMTLANKIHSSAASGGGGGGGGGKKGLGNGAPPKKDGILLPLGIGMGQEMPSVLQVGSGASLKRPNTMSPVGASPVSPVGGPSLLANSPSPLSGDAVSTAGAVVRLPKHLDRHEE